MTKEEALRLLKTQRIDGDDLHEAFDMAIKALEEQKVGKWIPHYSGYRHYHGYDCSICGKWCEFLREFCGHCGERMEGEEDGSLQGIPENETDKV